MDAVVQMAMKRANVHIEMSKRETEITMNHRLHETPFRSVEQMAAVTHSTTNVWP